MPGSNGEKTLPDTDLNHVTERLREWEAQQRRDDLLEVVAIHAYLDLCLRVEVETIPPVEARLLELRERLWPSLPDAPCPPGEKKLVE